MKYRIPSSQIKENKSRTSLRERGNALIYVLIAIALFAALTFTVGRQTNNQEAGTLRGEEVELAASRLISYASQAETVIDQMTFAGSQIPMLDFVLPGQASYDTGSDIHKVYHPGGGGLIPATLSPMVISQSTNDPPPGWYLGRFNNIEWTKSEAPDVVLTAFQITQEVCQNLNKKITGSTDIPSLVGVDIEDVLINEAYHGASNNPDLEIVDCPECAEYHTLCVSNDNGTQWAFYSILAAE